MFYRCFFPHALFAPRALSMGGRPGCASRASIVGHCLDARLLHKEDVFEDAVGEIWVVSKSKASSLDRG
jgi:hypothetical protein